MLMRLSGMAIGHMMLANAPELTVGVSSQVLESGNYQISLRITVGDYVDSRL